jgi:hypothetical protein
MYVSTVAIYIPLQRESGKEIPEPMTEQSINSAKATFTQWGHTVCYEASFCRESPDDEKGYIEQRVAVVECQTPHVMERLDEIIRKLETVGGEIAKNLRVEKVYLRSPNGDIDPVARDI